MAAAANADGDLVVPKEKGIERVNGLDISEVRMTGGGYRYIIFFQTVSSLRNKARNRDNPISIRHSDTVHAFSPSKNCIDNAHCFQYFSGKKYNLPCHLDRH